MATCNCPADRKTIPSTERVILYEPKAITKNGSKTTKDMKKIHIYSKNCPLHGYTEVTND